MIFWRDTLHSKFQRSQFVFCYSLSLKGVLSIVVDNSLFDGYQQRNTFVSEYTKVFIEGLEAEVSRQVTSAVQVGYRLER
jgi:hypothetical protein